MARQTFVVSNGDLIPAAEYHAAKGAARHANRADIPTPQIMSDNIVPGRSQVSGCWHDTRSGLMRDYRDYEARTGRQVEIVGDQVQELTRDVPVKVDEAGIDKAIHEAVQRHS